jgi:hypothetical protein
VQRREVDVATPGIVDHGDPASATARLVDHSVVRRRVPGGRDHPVHVLEVTLLVGTDL